MFALLVLSIIALWCNFVFYPLALKVWARLGARGLTLPGENPDRPREWPRLAVIVPVLNEEKFIDRKLRNLFELDYSPAHREVLIVDGGSHDRTFELAERYAAEHSDLRISVLRAPVAGKVLQINAGLRRAQEAELVLITDADTEIRPRDALVRAADYFANNPGTAVVGGWTAPGAGSHPAEQLFLAQENGLRVLESIAYSSSLVIGTFCVFRRSLVAFLPEDCVADDAYISIRANASGGRVILARDIQALEFRAPLSLRELYRHKVRKAHVYCGELLRFLPLVGAMTPGCRALYGFKLFQFFLLPWLTLPLPLVLSALVVQGRVETAAIAAALAACALLGPVIRGTRCSELRREGVSLRSFAATVEYCAVIHLVLIFTPFVYLARPLDPAFERIGAT